MDLKNKKFIYYLFFAIAGLGLISFFDRALSVGIIFVVFLFLSFYLFIEKAKLYNKKLFLLFSIVFLIHLLAVLFIYYARFQPFGDGGGDYDWYNNSAIAMAGRLHNLDFSLGDSFKWGHYYPIIVGYIYALTIPSMLLGQIFNAWLSALIVVLVYLIIIELKGSEKGALLTSFAVSLYPSFIFYGSLLLKDTSVIFLSIAGLFLVIKILKDFSWTKFIIFYLVLAFLLNFRFYIGYALIFSFLISFFLFSNLKPKERIFSGLVILFLIGFLPQIFASQGYWGVDSRKQYLNEETITMYREFAYTEKNMIFPATLATPTTPTILATPATLTPTTSTVAKNLAYLNSEKNGIGSSFTLKTDFNNSILLSFNLAKSFIYSLLGPFPWQIKIKRQAFALLETIPWYFLLFFAIKGISKNIKKQYKEILPIVMFSLISLAVTSLFIANFGIITRIRIPAFIALLCFVPFGLKENGIIYKYLNKIYHVADKINSFIKKIFLLLCLKLKT